MPMTFSPPRYRFKCSVTVETFLNWTAGQLQKITYGKTRKSPRKKKYTWDMKTRNIPIQYVRILHQFTLEDEHGKTDSGHESLRRRTYAQSMLDRFGQELDAYRGPEANFRSKVLSPVLQRQLRGIPDTYAPVIRRAIAPGGAEVTISRVTIFYLGNDPLDPRCIPSYRRNLVYIREALWHLGILMGRFGVRSQKYFNLSLNSHDYIMDTLKGSPRPSARGVPPLGPMEVAMLVGQQVDSFFEKELARVVRNQFTNLLCHLLIISYYSLSISPSYEKGQQIWQSFFNVSAPQPHKPHLFLVAALRRMSLSSMMMTGAAVMGVVVMAVLNETAVVM
jgi:hypothetical protein